MLKISKQAINQLNRGSNISKASAPVLDQFFKDDDMFNEIKLTGTYATPDTNVSNSPSTVRGLPGIYMNKLFAKSLLKGAFEGEFFRLSYIPPWHPLAAGRSTRPAIAVCYKQGVAFNGKNLDAITPRPGISRSVFDYAVWRYKTKATYKKLFMNAWTRLSKTENGPRDGVYLIMAKKYPVGDECADVQNKIARYLKRVASEEPKFDSKDKKKLTVSAGEQASVNAKAPMQFTPQQWNWGYIK